jgi:glutaminyl-peptide cyclotransferase
VIPRFLAVPIVAAALGACDGCSHVPEPAPPSSAAPPAPTEAPHPGTISPTTLGQAPHDPHAFTQGLLFANGAFLESTGVYGESPLRRVDPATGKVLLVVKLPADVFGEGLARVHGELFQLTWKEHRCFVYDDRRS